MRLPDQTRRHAPSSRPTGVVRLCLCASVALAISIAQLRAEDVAKANNADNLNLGTSWVRGTPPGSGDIAVWDGTVTGANTVLLGADTSWAGIRVVNPGGAVVISAGSTLTSGAAGIDLGLATANLSLGCPVSLGAAQTWNVGAGASLTLSGTVSGANTLTKAGPGTLVLGAANTFTLGTVINGGVVQANNGTSFGASASGVTNNGATLRVNTTTSLANPINANGAVTVDLNNVGGNQGLVGPWSGAGTVTFINQQNNTRIFTLGGGSGGNLNGFTGTIDFGTNSGTLRFNDGGSSPSLGNPGATFNLGTGSATNYTRNRGVTVQYGALLGGPNTVIRHGTSSSGTTVFSIGGLGTSTTFQGTFMDGGSGAPVAITKVGAGTLTLTGPNSNVGTTTINGGTLQIGNQATSGQLGSGPIVNNGTLVYTRTDDLTINNAISGSGSLVLQGGNIVTFQGTNASSGALIVNTGTAVVGGSGVLSCPIFLNTGATLDLTLNGAFALNSALSGKGLVSGLVTAGSGASLRPGGNGAPGTLSFANGLWLSGNVILNFELSDDATGTSKANDRLAITGDLTLDGANTVVISKLDPSLPAGTYRLLTYTGNLIGSLASLSTGNPYYTLANPPGAIDLVVASTRPPANLMWVGNATSNVWDSTATNWLNGAFLDTFLSGDSVVFNATGLGNPTVSLVGVLTPQSVRVEAGGDYRFTGPGNLAGVGGILKSNTGTLTLESTNDYSGPTILAGGTIEATVIANGASASSIGASSSDPTNLVFYGTKLRYTGGNASTDRGATLGGPGAEIQVVSANLDFTTTPFTGPGRLCKSGAGTLTLTVPNTYAGGTVISNGVLALGANAANNNGAGFGALGAVTNPVVFHGGTLQLFGYSGSTANNYSTLYNPLIVPAGESGVLRLFPRGPVNSGGAAGLQSSLAGGGTLNLVVNYVRDDLSGDWSAFTGLINVTGRGTSGDEMRINNSFGYARCTINLNDGVTLCRSFTPDTINDIGALTGTSLSTLGPGNSSGARSIWRIGWLNGNETFSGTLADDAGSTVMKVGTGKWTLDGVVAVGNLVVSNGTLAVNSFLSSTNIRVAAGAFLDVSTISTLWLGTGQVVGGNGTVLGSVDTSGGGTVAPGFGIGNLTVTNSVTLGGSIVMQVDRNGGVPISDKLVSPNIWLGGALRVVPIGAALHVGDTFDLFDGAILGSFATQMLGYYTWDTSRLAVDGTIRVTGTLPPPSLGATTTGTELVLSATGGLPSGDLVIVTSTDADLPLDAWTIVQTASFDATGSFIATIPMDIATPHRYYAIRAF